MANTKDRKCHSGACPADLLMLPKEEIPHLLWLVLPGFICCHGILPLLPYVLPLCTAEKRQALGSGRQQLDLPLPSSFLERSGAGQLWCGAGYGYHPAPWRQSCSIACRQASASSSWSSLPPEQLLPTDRDRITYGILARHHAVLNHPCT